MIVDSELSYSNEDSKHEHFVFSLSRTVKFRRKMIKIADRIIL